MPGPSRLPATSGHRDARTSRGSVGGTPDSNITRRPGLRSPRVHLGARRNQGPVASATGTHPDVEGTAVELHDGGPEIASVGAVRLTVSLVGRTVLFALLGMLAWALLPFALGWHPTTVMTGSMEPRISAGDVVIARPIPTGTASLGQILLVDDPDHTNKLRLHRYVEAAPDGNLILRGDANQANDSSPVTPEVVHGVAVLRVPYVGLPVVWLAEKNWGNLAAVFVAVSALTLAAASGSSAAPRGAQDAKNGTTRGPQGPPQAHTARPAIRRRVRATTRSSRSTRTIRALLCLAALPVLVAPELLMAAPAHAAFSAAAPTQASSFTSLSSYSCLSRTVQDNPSLFYAFNEGAGTVAEDSSGNGRSGTLRGAAARVAGSCAAGQSPALALNGSSAHVSTPLPAVSAPDTFTVEIWFKTTTGSTAGGRLIGFGNAQTGDSTVSDRHLYMTSTGAIAFGAAPNPGNSQNYKATAITSAPGYNNGAWHQATATMSAAGMKLYVDSVLVNQNNVSSGADISGYWRVGYDAMSTNNWTGISGNPVFAGSVDNAAVYPAALTAAQVQAHYAAGR